ncbi:MAG: hypothetical protein IPM70_10675 [Proteobacteria bacterium]|nr:hypothetical protein [Pseudomonadota bacterium]
MSAWVDFGLYSLQAVLLWIVVPAWAARALRPLVTDNTPATTHRGAGWVRLLQAWGALSVLLLLAYRLDAIPPPLSASALHKHDWEVQLMTSNLMLALGLLFAAYGLWRFVQWMKESAAAPEKDSAESFPLTRDDFLPRGLQYGVYGLLLAGLLARPLAGLIWPERVSDIWGSLFMSIVVVVLLLFAAAGSVMRAPNHLDRALGPRYRWLEVSLCYLLLGNLALLEMASFALELSGLGSRRHVALLVAAFVSVTLGGVLLLASLRPRAPVRH